MRSSIRLALLATLALSPYSAWALCDYFNFTLDSGQVVPPPQDVSAGGWSELTLCDDDSLRGYVASNLTETVTGVHIHGPAQSTENGPELFALPLPTLGYVPVTVGNALQYRGWFILNQSYVDFHTTAHPDGAIRGVIHTEIAVESAHWTIVKVLYR